MEVDIQSRGAQFTEEPRALTVYEAQRIRQSSRLDGVKLHREWTHSTLAAAVRVVDALQGAPPASA